MSSFRKEINETKALQRFKGLIRNLKQNLELLDVSLTLANKVCKDNSMLVLCFDDERWRDGKKANRSV